MTALEKIKNILTWSKNHRDDGDLMVYLTKLKKSFDNNLTKFRSSDKLINVLESLLIEISEPGFFKIDLFKKLTDEDNLWTSLIDKKKWCFKEKNNVLNEKDSIVFLKQCTKNEERSEK